jgi:hypothetical protein
MINFLMAQVIKGGTIMEFQNTSSGVLQQACARGVYLEISEDELGYIYYFSVDVL